MSAHFGQKTSATIKRNVLYSWGFFIFEISATSTTVPNYQYQIKQTPIQKLTP